MEDQLEALPIPGQRTRKGQSRTVASHTVLFVTMLPLVQNTNYKELVHEGPEETGESVGKEWPRPLRGLLT